MTGKSASTTGWKIKIGRGFDFYQKPEGWFAIDANDLACDRAWNRVWIFVANCFI